MTFNALQKVGVRKKGINTSLTIDVNIEVDDKTDLFSNIWTGILEGGVKLSGQRGHQISDHLCVFF